MHDEILHALMNFVKRNETCIVQRERKGRLEAKFSLLCLGFLRLKVNNMIKSPQTSKGKCQKGEIGMGNSGGTLAVEGQ